MSKTTGRRPNVHVFLSRWVATGFADRLVEAIERVKAGGEDEIFALYMPQPHQQAWARLTHERVPPEVLAECKAAIEQHPIEWTIRKADPERTLLYTQEDESSTCPPRCT